MVARGVPSSCAAAATTPPRSVSFCSRAKASCVATRAFEAFMVGGACEVPAAMLGNEGVCRFEVVGDPFVSGGGDGENGVGGHRRSSEASGGGPKCCPAG